jgi:transcriptional regulator with XRE-family HTH domain
MPQSRIARNEFNTTLGAIIREQRNILGLTLDEVGKNPKLNFSKVTLSTIERGEQGLSAFHLFILCDILKIKIEDLREKVFRKVSPDIVFTSEKNDKKIVLEVI